MKKISIIVPIYNEEESLPFLKNRLLNTISKIKNYEIEIILVNDGSKDNSLAEMREICKHNLCFKYISLSRNYGKEVAMLAGLDYCRKSDSVIFLDADLQDPPELIEKMIEEWENGYDDIYARRISREGESWIKKFTSKMYYKVLAKMTKIPIQKDTGDFRLLDKRCVQALCQMREKNRCSKSLFSWIGYNKKEITFEREKRIAGTTKWNYINLTKLAIDGITSLSTKPLNIPIYVSIILGIALIIYTVTLGVSVIVGKTIVESNFLILILLLFFTIQMIIVSIFGVYLGKIFEETKGRPVYLIDEINGEREKNNERYNTQEGCYNNLNFNHYSAN